jgi:hypothetical protein
MSQPMADMARNMNLHRKNLALESLSKKRDAALKAGNFAAALSECRRALQIAPGNATVHGDAAVCLTMLGRHEEAVQAAQKAVALGNETLGPLDTLAHSNGALGRWDEAARWGRQALEKRDAMFGKDGEDAGNHAPVAMPRPSPETRNRNVIAFSLFGNLPKYCETAIFNAIDQPHIYPNWTCHFHVDDAVPDHVIRRLEAAGAVIIKAGEKHARVAGTMWRFLSYDTPGLHRIIFRDADSIISSREKSAVEEWVQSDRKFHVMRDAESHTELLMAGLWGCVAGALPAMAGLMERSTAQDTQTGRYTDQFFLREMVWPIARRNLLTHDSIFGFMSPQPFPDGPRRDDTHVGICEGSQIQFPFEKPEGSTIAWSIFNKDGSGPSICTYYDKIHGGKVQTCIPRRLAALLREEKLLIRVKAVPPMN